VNVMPKFAVAYCSNCGGEFGPGEHGYSHCWQHSKSGLVRRLEAYALDWRARAASDAPVLEAIAEIKRLMAVGDDLRKVVDDILNSLPPDFPNRAAYDEATALSQVTP
jgi:hypothetical protein